ncbi:MAG TPA: molybdopterin molybdenumtransferase MoeA, partial [Nitrospirae bacterium]|nr:molybdopterin molybdenumtransferase MoeA [Nitrospirota bacterium]
EPVVSLISTGNEIVPPEVTPSPGQVRDINSFNLFGLIRENGGIPVKKGIISDEIEKLRAVVSESLRESDMVIITGGSSVGTRDYAAKIIAEFGSPGILFHGVAIKPGKPIIGALVKGIPVFGLPGHPAAVTVSFKIFVKPVLSRLSGEAPRAELADIKKVKAVFSRNLSSSIGREEHIRVYLEHVNGTLRAVPILGKSGLIKTLVKSDGLVKIPFEKNGLYEGEEVEVLVFS